MNISKANVRFSGSRLLGEGVVQLERRLSDLAGIFADDAAYAAARRDEVVYRVESFEPVGGGIAGGLFFGVTHLLPGTIGDEYFMTKGHYHDLLDRGEFYWGIAGEGLLVLMDAERRSRVEEVHPGSVHYVPGHTAHRLVNTGSDILDVGACWPSDAGHDYDSITDRGFSIRIFEGESGPEITEQ